MSQNSLKISIIVPVYNVEKYIEECVESIINQDYLNLEIILINDGSTDSSPQICEKYAEKDNRIIYISQENAGVSAARNRGLDIATGDFINFIDSDDWINPGMYSYFIQCINNNNDIDILYMPLGIDKSNITSKVYNKSEVHGELIKHFIGYKKVKLGKMASVCSLFIRRSLIRNMAFEKISMAEDKLFFIEVMLRANKVYVRPTTFYNYRIVNNSAVHRYQASFSEDITKVNETTWYLLKKYGTASKELLKRHNNTVLDFYLHLIRNEARNTQLKTSNKILESYYKNNEIGKLLTWSKVIKEIPNKPKLFLIKLGFTNYLVKSKWKKLNK